MDIEPLFRWLQGTPVAQLIRSSNGYVDGLETIHLFGLCLLGGTVLMVDLSLMGIGPGGQPVAAVARDLAPWTRRGLTIMLVTGPLLFLGEAVRCYERPWFGIKMAILVVALLFHFGSQQPAAKADPPMSRSRAATVGAVSLALWIGVALAAKIFGV